ncbi:MAG: hydrolase 1, exosortase A system-associated [Steroidobacter sp.]
MSSTPEVPVVFECAGEQLLAVMHHAGARVGVLVVVGGPQYRVGSHRQFVLMSRALAQAGYSVFRFDYRGMGDSDGAPRNFEAISEDIRVAIDAFVKQAPQLQGVVLWGLCDAASACLMYASTDTRVRAAIIANPWVHTEAGAATAYIKHYYGRRLLQRSFWAKVVKGDFKVGESIADFARKLARASTGARSAAQPAQSFIERMRAGLQRFTGPVLVLMSENDLTAQEFRGLCCSNTAWAKLLARKDCEVAELDGADHTFSSREALDRVTRRCVEWLREHARALDATAAERKRA